MKKGFNLLKVIPIPGVHHKLLTSLRTAHDTSYDDLLDALRLSLKGYNLK
jgi:hypothetical protein